MRGIAFLLTAVLTVTDAQRRALMEGVLLPPTAGQIKTVLPVEFGGLALISLIGLVILWAMWRRVARPPLALAAD